MRILFVGNEDIAGKYIAERLYKEGHKIYLLTEEKSSLIFNENIKVNVYKCALTSRRSKNIFKGNSIDVVIFMTGKYRDNLEKSIMYKNNKGNNSTYENHINVEEYESMIPDLMNILRISTESKVKQFVFLSSTELDNDDILKPILTDLKAGEELCKSWEKIYNVSILRLRVSSIYGIAPYHYMGYTGKIEKRILDKEHIELEFNKESTIDLIYGEDFADAVFRALLEEKTGLYRMTSGKTITLEEYVNIIANTCEYRNHIHFASNTTIESINTKVLDDSFKKETSFIALHDFKENGAKIIKEAKELNDKLKKDKNDKQKSNYENQRTKKIKKIVKSTIENILLFLISLIVLIFTKEQNDFRFVDIRLVYIVIISISYGIKQGLLASILASISYGYDVVNSGVDITYLIYSVDTWTPFIMYFITSATVGYVSDKKDDDNEAVTAEKQILSEKYDFLKEIYIEVCDVKEQLQRQIMVSKDSFGRVFDIIKELDTFKPELIFFKAINILEDIMECKEVAIYDVNTENSKYARLMANSTSLAEKLTSSMNLDDYPEIRMKIIDKELYVNKELKENYPSYVAPILDKDKIIAIVVIYRVDFDKYTIYYQNLLKIVTEMVQTNLARAYVYENSIYKKKYVKDTMILKADYYNEKLKVLEDAKEELKISYLSMIIKSEDENMSVVEFSKKVVNLLRNTDFIGIDDNEFYHVVFMHTDNSSVELLTNRFKNSNLIILEEVKEDE